MAGPWFMVQSALEDWQSLGSVWISDGDSDCQGTIAVRLRWPAQQATRHAIALHAGQPFGTVSLTKIQDRKSVSDGSGHRGSQCPGKDCLEHPGNQERLRQGPVMPDGVEPTGK